MHTANPPRKPRIRFLLVFFMLQRILMNTVHRLVYPFLPVLARAFGVSTATLSSAASIRSLGGLGVVFLARHADSRGRKFGILLGNVLFILGVGLVVLFPTFPVFIAALGIASLGKHVLDSSIQAFIGDQVPVRLRGRAFGIIELGWSLSYLVGIWGVRLMMERGGWLAPFPPIFLLGLLGLVGVYAWVPGGGGHAEKHKPLLGELRGLLAAPLTRRALAVGLLISAGNELVSLVFAVWLEDSLSFSLANLAGAAVFIGLAELAGEGLVGTWMDRLGSVRSVRWGIILNILFTLLLPVFAAGATGAYAGLFLFYLTFEFTIVSGLSMLTEVTTKNRATFMSLNMAGLGIGRIVSAWVAIPLYGLGIWAVMGVAVIINLGALAALRGVLSISSGDS